MLLAVERIGDGSAVNIGTGKLTTFLEVASLFAELAGSGARVQPSVGKPVGVQSRYCDPTQMVLVLGWTPQISLRDGFRRVLYAAFRRVEVIGRSAIV
jgi:nucleoside-diphosphate-sugar epimerase